LCVLSSQDPKFDNNLAAQLDKQGVNVNKDQLSVGAGVTVKEVISTALIAGLSGGAILCTVFLAVGAYKLNQLAKSGNINSDGGGERSRLTGHDRL
jgi:hypothetical protein